MRQSSRTDDRWARRETKLNRVVRSSETVWVGLAESGEACGHGPELARIQGRQRDKS
jgi:hypothetical protein